MRATARCEQPCVLGEDCCVDSRPLCSRAKRARHFGHPGARQVGPNVGASSGSVVSQQVQPKHTMTRAGNTVPSIKRAMSVKQIVRVARFIKTSI